MGTVLALLAFIFDSTIFVLTLRKTYNHGTVMRRRGGLSIAQLILRDGELSENSESDKADVVHRGLRYILLCVSPFDSSLPATT